MSAAARTRIPRLTVLLAASITLLLALVALPATTHAAEDASITGQVLTSTGDAGVDVEVVLLRRDAPGDTVPDFRAVDWAHTDDEGRYTFRPAPGTYAVLAQPGDEAHGVPTYSPSSSATAATVVTVAEGSTLSADIHLHPGTILSGRVFSPDGTTPAAAQVHLEGPTQQAVETDVDGNWSARVQAGTWSVRAEASTGVPTFYRSGGSTAVVASGSGNRTGLDVQLDRGHVLSGRITVAGTPLADAEITAEEVDTGLQVVVSSGADGQFRVHVPAGRYRLAGHPQDPQLTTTYWPGTTDPDAATVLVVTADRGSLDLTLSGAGGTTMSGTVRTPDGDPADEVMVCLQHLSSSQTCVASTVSDETGHWAATGLVDGTYRIRLTSPSPRFTPSFHPATTLMTQAVSFTVADGVAITGVQSTLVRAGQISGTLQGSPTEQIEVTAEQLNGGTGVTSVRSRTDGTFTLTPLAAGSYRIGLNIGARETIYAASFHDGVLESAGAAGATPLTLNAGQQRSGLSLKPIVGGVVTGRLVTPAGVGVPGAPVRAFAPDGSLSPRFTTTDGNGRFTLAGLDNGSYRLGLLAPLTPENTSFPAYYAAGNASTRTTATATAATPLVTRVGSTVRLEQNLVVDTTFEPVDGWGIELIDNPGVSGTARVGQTLTADPGRWTTTPTHTETTWFVDGRRVGTGPTYTLRSSDLGGHVSMRVEVESVSGDGDHIRGTAWSGEIGPVTAAPTITATTRPTLRGTAAVGQKIVLHLGTWTPSDTRTQVTWLRNGVVVPGATSTSYVLTTADVGSRISARVFGTRPDSTSVTVTTVTTTSVKAVSTTAVKATPGTRKVTLRITVTAPGLSRAKVTGPVRVKVNGRTVKASLKSGKATVTVKKLKKGRRTVTVSYGGNAAALGSSRKVTVKVR